MSKRTTPSIFMESTEISAQRTAAEITGKLVEAGARSISMDYGDGGKIIGMSFVLMVHDFPHPFKLPVRTAAVEKIFQRRREQTMKHRADEWADKDREQAERVAWRQMLRWIEAQVAMIQTGMVQSREVFAPYLVESASGRTLFEYLDETRFKALPAATGKAGRH